MQNLLSSTIFIYKDLSSVGQEIRKLNNSVIAKAVTVLVALPIIVFIQAPNGSASFEDHGSGESSVDTSCTGEVSAFPSSIYTQLQRCKKGSISGFEIRLFYAEKNCSATLYASNAQEGEINAKAYYRVMTLSFSL